MAIFLRDDQTEIIQRFEVGRKANGSQNQQTSKYSRNSQKNNKHSELFFFSRVWNELTKRYKILRLVKMKCFIIIFFGYFCPSKELSSNSKATKLLFSSSYGRVQMLAIHGRFYKFVLRSRISFHHIKFDFYFLLVGNNVSTQLPANSRHKNDFNILEKSLVVTTERKTWGRMHDPRILTISLTTICVQVNYVMRLMLKFYVILVAVFLVIAWDTK